MKSAIQIHSARYVCCNMINRPYDMSVTAAEFDKSNAWWRNLSINEMKALEKKHFPHRQHATQRMIHQMWEEEGKPAPHILACMVRVQNRTAGRDSVKVIGAKDEQEARLLAYLLMYGWADTDGNYDLSLEENQPSDDTVANYTSQPEPVTTEVPWEINSCRLKRES